MPHTNPPTASPLANVLILDDESCVRGLLGRWLTAAGYQCAEARDSGEVWQLLARQEFQLITLDVRMPGESGLDLVHQLKREYPDLAILMVTAVEVAIEAVQALTRGAYGYLIKPIDCDALLFHVRGALAERQRTIDDRNYLRWLETKIADRPGHSATGATPPHKRKPTNSNLLEARWTAN